MRMRVNKLVYVLIGGALAAGLLMTAFVRPESRLAASGNCYGLCPSVTALSLSSSTVRVGEEQAERFSVRLSAGSPGTGLPTGYVAVESGTRFLCSIHVYHRGQGSCSPSARALARGTYRIVAHYSGNRHYFKPSTSGPRTLTVLRH